MDLGLAGKHALVTGSTAGIGYAIAKGLATEGASVIVTGRTKTNVDAAVTRIRQAAADPHVTGIVADCATAAGAKAVFEQVPELDILVNNLGIYGRSSAFEIDDAEWQRFWEVNVLSGIRLTRTYLPGMRERGWGRVQFLASDSAVVIPEEMVHYGVTKTALLGVSRGYAKAMAGTGVTVNAVMAGPTHTEGVETFARSLVGDDLPWEEAQRRFMREHRPNSLLQRLIEPEEIANMVAYLSSDLASATTGGALRVDGGYVDNIVP